MNKPLQYAKMTGSGNDFILIDNMDGRYDNDELLKIVPKVCARGVSIGADGFIIIVPADANGGDFKWIFHNADGSVAEMCGNGSRCAARFAYLQGHVGKTFSFMTLAGLIQANIKDGNNVKVQLTKPFGMVRNRIIRTSVGEILYNFINTGVPHMVIFADDIEEVDAFAIGREIRYHNDFKPAGTNVNFAKVLKDGSIRVRTYERGVEAETLACGTGSVACALIAIDEGLASSPVKIITSSGAALIVYKEGDNVFLEGEARLLTHGEINPEAYTY